MCCLQVLNLPDPDELECFFFRKLLFVAIENDIGFLGGGGGGGDCYNERTETNGINN